jgi:hypothetical protein
LPSDDVPLFGQLIEVREVHVAGHVGSADVEVEVLIRVEVNKVLLFVEVMVKEILVLDVLMLVILVLETEATEERPTDEDGDSAEEIALGLWLDEDAKDWDKELLESTALIDESIASEELLGGEDTITELLDSTVLLDERITSEELLGEDDTTKELLDSMVLLDEEATSMELLDMDDVVEKVTGPLMPVDEGNTDGLSEMEMLDEGAAFKELLHGEELAILLND